MPYPLYQLYDDEHSSVMLVDGNDIVRLVCGVKELGCFSTDDIELTVSEAKAVIAGLQNWLDKTLTNPIPVDAD